MKGCCAHDHLCDADPRHFHACCNHWHGRTPRHVAVERRVDELNYLSHEATKWDNWLKPKPKPEPDFRDLMNDLTEAMIESGVIGKGPVKPYVEHTHALPCPRCDQERRERGQPWRIGLACAFNPVTPL